MSELLDGLADLFVHEVVVTPRTFDGYGDSSDGVAFPISAYVYGQAAKVKDREGIFVDARYVIVTDGYFGLTDRHRFTLPSQFYVVSGECIAVVDHTDENGPHHQTVYL